MRSNLKTITNKFSIILLLITGVVPTLQAGTGLTGMNIGFDATMSGSLLRGSISPALDLDFDRHSLKFGLNIQTKKINFSGLQCSYRYTIVKSESERMRLYTLANIQFQKGAYLSNYSVKEETLTAISRHKEVITDYANMRLNAIELYLGFGVNLKHSSRLCSSLSIGSGMYQTLGEYDRSNMYRDKWGLSLLLKCGLSYNLFTR